MENIVLDYNKTDQIGPRAIVGIDVHQLLDITSEEYDRSVKSDFLWLVIRQHAINNLFNIDDQSAQNVPGMIVS